MDTEQAVVQSADAAQNAAAYYARAANDVAADVTYAITADAAAQNATYDALVATSCDDQAALWEGM